MPTEIFIDGATMLYASSSNKQAHFIVDLNEGQVGMGLAREITTGSVLGSLRSVDRSDSWFERKLE